MIENMRRDNIVSLAKALNISPAILMGWEDYDLKEKNNTNLSKEENILLNTFNILDINDKNKVIDYSNLLSLQDKYKKDETIKINTPSNDELCAPKVVELPKKEKFIWEEPGKEHLMPVACHDDDLTDEERAIVNERLNEI